MESTPRHVHTLVRLLKSPSDPPLPQGPLKIEIANRAWSDATFCAANKGEVLAEWLLGSLGRDVKRSVYFVCSLWDFHLEASGRDDKNGESKRQMPIADPKYWALLQQTLASSVSSARPLKVWLPPLLSRINLAAIISQLLALSQNRTNCNDLALVYTPARAALAILWPLAEKRVGMDMLVESLSTVLGACTTWIEDANDVTLQTYREDLAWVCKVIINSYSDTLGKFGNKKKVGVCRFCINRRSSVITYCNSYSQFSCLHTYPSGSMFSQSPPHNHRTICRRYSTTRFTPQASTHSSLSRPSSNPSTHFWRPSLVPPQTTDLLSSRAFFLPAWPL